MKERTWSTAVYSTGLFGRGMLLVLGICLFQGPTLGAAAVGDRNGDRNKR
jgi:hypothetical protein